MRGEPCVIGCAQTASNPPPCCIVVMVWADKGVRDFVEDDATNGVPIIEIGERSGQSDRLRPVDAGSCSALCRVEFECPVAQFGGVHQYARFVRFVDPFQIVSIRPRTRFADTLLGVPSCWAKKETRSSSINHRTCEIVVADFAL